jgi:hypothetical protein
MATAFDLLEQAASAPSVPTMSQEELAQMEMPNFDLVAAGIDTGSGMNSAGEIEKDLRTLSPTALRTKYGNDVGSYLGYQVFAAGRKRDKALNAKRSALEVVSDSITGVAKGLINIPASGLETVAGMVAPGYGPDIAKNKQYISNWIKENLYSQPLRDTKKYVQLQNILDQRDSQFKYEKAIAQGISPLVSTLAREGSNAISSIKNTASNSIALSQVTAETVGTSILIILILALLKKLLKKLL